MSKHDKKITSLDALKFFYSNVAIITGLESSDNKGCAEKCYEIIRSHILKNCHTNIVMSIYSDNFGYPDAGFYDIIDKLGDLGFKFSIEDLDRYLKAREPSKVGGVLITRNDHDYIISHEKYHDGKFDVFEIK